MYKDLNTSIDYMKRLTQTQASLPAELPFALDNDYKNYAKIFEYKRYIDNFPQASLSTDSPWPLQYLQSLLDLLHRTSLHSIHS